MAITSGHVRVFTALTCAAAMLVGASDASAQRRKRGGKRRAQAPVQQEAPPPDAQPAQDGYGNQPPQPAPQSQDPYGYGYQPQQPPPQQPAPQSQDPYGYGYQPQQPPPQQPGPQGQAPYGYGYPQQQPVPPGQDPYASPQPPVAPAADELEAGPAQPSPVDPTLVLGVGMTSRAVELPSQNGMRQLDIGLTPAVDLELGARVYGSGYHLQINAAYQTSIGLDGTRAPLDDRGAAVETPVRTHRIEVGLTPAYHFDEGRDSVSLGLCVAYVLRGLDSVVELSVPKYTLHGPLARVEFEVPLLDGALTLRLAPELWAVVSTSAAAREVSSMGGSALALGAEASATVEITDWISARLAYRESHASANTAVGASFTDVERYVMLGALIHYFGGEP